MLKSRHAAQRSAFIAAAIGISVALCQTSAASTAADGKGEPEPAASSSRPFTLNDAIKWGTIKSLSRDYYNPSPALFSPDGSYFVFRTTEGDLERDVVHDRLFLFRTADVERYMHGPIDLSAPRPQLIADVSVSNYWRQISNVSWLSSTEIAFIAESEAHISQAYVVDIGHGGMQQVTRHETDVKSFGINGDAVVYYALAPASARPPVVAEEARFPGTVIAPVDFARPSELFRASRTRHDIKRIDAPSVWLAQTFLDPIWISPSGKYAVTFTAASAWPDYWAEYAVHQPKLFGYMSDRKDPQTLFRARLQLVDIECATARPLIDAPNAYLAGNLTPMKAFWRANERSVVVSNTFLPLTAGSEDERRRRTHGPAIAEVDVQSGRARAIVWEPRATSATGSGEKRIDAVRSITWNDRTEQLTVVSETSGSLRNERYVPKPGSWRKLETRSIAEEEPPLSVRLRESLHDPPKLVAHGKVCRCERVLFDPNPNSDQFEFGKPELYRWTDRNGLTWKGGLIYPLRYTAGRRYPLVVQTHGFSEDEFLINGPHEGTTAVAAQPLAAAGFFVLQVEDNKQVATSQREDGTKHAEGYRAAIARLIADGLVDHRRIGFEAFSHTGYAGITLLVEQPDLVRAAVIADAAVGGYFDFLQGIHRNADIQAQMDAMMSPLRSFTADDISTWMSGSPTYKLPHISTAVRMEALTPGSVLAMWETYAVLRYAMRPAELVYIPGDFHVLFKPQNRLISQGGAIDWYRFWLQDVEDPAPAKRDQYQRWERLRNRAAGGQENETH